MSWASPISPGCRWVSRIGAAVRFPTGTTTALLTASSPAFSFLVAWRLHSVLAFGAISGALAVIPLALLTSWCLGSRLAGFVAGFGLTIHPMHIALSLSENQMGLAGTLFLLGVAPLACAVAVGRETDGAVTGGLASCLSRQRPISAWSPWRCRLLRCAFSPRASGLEFASTSVRGASPPCWASSPRSCTSCHCVRFFWMPSKAAAMSSPVHGGNSS